MTPAMTVGFVRGPDGPPTGAGAAPDPGFESRLRRLEEGLPRIEFMFESINERLRKFDSEMAGMRSAIERVDDRARSDTEGLRAAIEKTHERIRVETAETRNLIGRVDDRIRRIEVELAEVKGRVSQLPSMWQMLTGLIAGQIGLAGVLVAALRMTWHG